MILQNVFFNYTFYPLLLEKESFVKLKATVRITSENWSADLLNKNSYSYVQLRKKLEDAVRISRFKHNLKSLCFLALFSRNCDQ